MSDYTINFTAPSTDSSYKTPFTVTEGTLNTTSTSLALCGHNYPNYGTTLWTNMVHMLENFSGSVSPLHSTKGQTWYDSGTDKLMVHNGTDYVYIEGNDALLLTSANLETLLKTRSYFDDMYVKRSGDTGVGSLELASGNNIVLTGKGTIQFSADPIEGEDGVNRYYLKKVLLALGYDLDTLFNSASGVSTIYLQLTGGKMADNAVIEFIGKGTVKVNDDPVSAVDVVNKSYAERMFVSFDGPNTKSVVKLTMSGPLTLALESCDVLDDSLEAVPAQWVTDKIKKALASGNQPGGGLFIPITSTTGTTVTNNLTFTKNNWVKVDLDAANWNDPLLVLNQKQADTLYVTKINGALAGHPFNFTQPGTQPTVPEEQLDSLKVPTCGWVNHRIQASGGGGSTGATASKLSTYGQPFAVPATQKTEPTTPNQTISLTIPSNTAGIDYEIRLGSTLSTTATGALLAGTALPSVRYVVKANGTKVYESTALASTSLNINATHPYDDLHTFKYSSPANTSNILTVEIYAFCYSSGVTTNSYNVSQWIIADPLSAKVTIAATTAAPTTTSAVTSGTDTATGISYIDYGNGMVTMSGITTAGKLVKWAALTSGGVSPYMMVQDVTLPFNMQVPYDVRAVFTSTYGTLLSADKNDAFTVNSSMMIRNYSTEATGNFSNSYSGGDIGNISETSFTLQHFVPNGTKAPWNDPSKIKVYWKLDGFKKVL